ncbi:MAG: hypothetical protein M3456_06705 [Actinomycetota bacterium]|nr:hypothetical protein [Actinomycetota bacterium]
MTTIGGARNSAAVAAVRKPEARSSSSTTLPLVNLLERSCFVSCVLAGWRAKGQERKSKVSNATARCA